MHFHTWFWPTHPPLNSAGHLPSPPSPPPPPDLQLPHPPITTHPFLLPLEPKNTATENPTPNYTTTSRKLIYSPSFPPIPPPLLPLTRSKPKEPNLNRRTKEGRWERGDPVVETRTTSAMAPMVSRRLKQWRCGAA